jgi:hypothetical protein
MDDELLIGIQDNEPCPWGEEIISLSAKELKCTEKRWLGLAVATKLSTTKELFERFKISRVLLNRYAVMYKKGKKHHEASGRPHCLDDTAGSSMQDFLRNGYDGRLCVLRARIRSEALDSKRRRGQWEDEEDSDVPELSGRSLDRCMVTCKQFCNNENIVYDRSLEGVE